MVKHKRWSDKQKSDSTDATEPQISTPQISDIKLDSSLKSVILSGIKYAYIIVIGALLCGIFTPLTLGIEIEDVIFGMLSIFLGLGGGILILLGKKSQRYVTLAICSGLAIMITSSILIFQLSGSPLFR